MQADLAGVDRRKEVPANKRQQQKGSRHDGNRSDQCRPAMVKHHAQRPRIAILHPEIAFVEAIVYARE